MAAEVAPPACVFEGFVLDPSGLPAEGALVVTNLGGQALVGEDGAFRLELHVPLAVQSVQVTAVGAGSRNLVASTSVPLAPSGYASAGTLALTSSGSCPPSWLPTFGPMPGVEEGGIVRAMVVHDDGSGPALFIGGSFTSAGGVLANRIARWDGTSWSALGAGLAGSVFETGVYSLAEYDDGSGPALFVGGRFQTAGGIPSNGIARWDGSNWAAVGGGLDPVGTGTVAAMAVWDGGGGPVLYLGGGFSVSGISNVASWNGTSWGALGTGVNGEVSALTVYDGGSGPALFAGGQFTAAGGVTTRGIARWDGTSWAALGGGVGSTNGYVRALAVYDDGGGPALHAGGSFSSIGGVTTGNLARWDGASWSALGGGVGPTVACLSVYDDGRGPALYAGGAFTTAGGLAANRIARWDGTSWETLGSGIGLDYPYALAAFDDGGGSRLYAGGDFDAAGGGKANSIVHWDGASWGVPGSGLNRDVHALAVFDDGRGLALFAGGVFDLAGGRLVNRIARWDGTSWSALGSGALRVVHALTVFDDGTGPALYAGGELGSPLGSVVRWDGTDWSAVGPFTHKVHSLAVYDGGSGPQLYAGGDLWFGVSENGIARWDGSTWSPVGTGFQPIDSIVYALAVFDDGSGSALYAGGQFTRAGSVTTNRIARWNGTSWSALGSGRDGTVFALTVHDDGSGPALHAGGDFTERVARWNGSSWSTLGGLIGSVKALASYDDGTGTGLYAGGVLSGGVARWNGASWSTLGSGTSGEVKVLTVFDDGRGPGLCVGGAFESAIDSGDSFLARWSADSAPTVSCPEAVFEIDPWTSPPGEVVFFTVTATDECDPAPVVDCVPPSGSLFPRGTTIVTCTATDAAGNRSECTFPVIVQTKARRR